MMRSAMCPSSTYKENFKGNVSFIHPDAETGKMSIAFQIVTPGVNFDLSHAGKGPSEGWFFFSCYNTEQAYSLLEVNASQRDKDFIMAVNWKMAEQLAKEGKGKRVPGKHHSNWWNHKTHSSETTVHEDVLQLDPKDHPGLLYFMPCPKSPHGCDVDPTGKYIVGSGKLAALIPVFSFEKMQKAIAANDVEGDFAGIPVLKYESVLHGEVKKPGLGPLHTEFDANGNAYTSFFVSSEIVKWNVEKLEVVDRVPTYYSIGHLCVPGGDSKQALGQVRDRLQQDHQGPLPAHRAGAHAERAALQHRWRQDGTAPRFPHHRRAALRAGLPSRPGEAPRGEVLQDR
jgi:nitrous-oxide reductase